jgi:hypothetical protein
MSKIYVKIVLYNIKNNHFASIASKFIMINLMMENNGLCVINVKNGLIHNALIYVQ